MSTPITLQTIEQEVANIAGRAVTTPISMLALWEEVQNLKATAKTWVIVTLAKTGNNFEYGTIEDKYLDWNWIILTGSTQSPFANENKASYSRNYNSVSIKTDSNASQNVTWTKNGNKIKINIGRHDWISSTITVLFYK